MKKTVLIAFLSLGTFSFASTGLVLKSSISEKNEKKETPKKVDGNEDGLCRVTCSMSIDNGMGGSTTISASAGSIFTSCETAQTNCHRKLMHELIDMIF